MEWYNYLSTFFAGVFLANFVPHFVNGISGNSFPTPFAKPPGKGLSSPVVNIAWSLFNLIGGFFLFKAAKVSCSNYLSLIIFFAGIASISLWLAKHFASKEKPKD
ncbi:hypothetical protein A9P82_03805 [Arachidicoccus ginsenosidimutans]|uniref:hypothetical protein n=1 Tax=Arachidicoccus sp. BS20 TaxID=1850526 RepID=UPI0007F0FDAE|nr:hypothetical protein [Arachidicoccus sp. BS20]ANI88499.1 hypothetical protein A9P82_03805 [Arachidicoccus sp. BS20]